MTPSPAGTQHPVQSTAFAMESSRPGKFWPGWRHLGYATALGCVQSLWFGLAYGGACCLASMHSYRVRIHFDAELDIPFVPGMVVFYASIFVLFLMTPFVLRTAQELRALAVAMATAILIAGIFFVLLPSNVAFAPRSDAGRWDELLRFCDLVNLDYNQLPSLHVGLSVICLDVFSRRAKVLTKGLLWIWALAICLSTVLIHEHHVLDVVTGLILALAVSRTIYSRLVARSDRPGRERRAST